MTAPRVLVWLTDNAGPKHYRFDVPVEVLQARGWQVDYGVPGPDLAERYDVLIGQRLHGPQPDWEQICADGKVLCIYEIDDDLTRLPPDHFSYPYFEPQVDGTVAALRAGHRVTVPNQAFADRMLELAPDTDIRILPICLPDEVYTYPLSQPSDRLVVGWGGSWAAQHDWDGAALLDPLVGWMTQHPEAEFHTMGADYTNNRVARLRVTGMQPPLPFYQGIDFHIGLAPLADVPFNSTKQHTKALYYAARGAAPICSPVGAYPQFIAATGIGLLSTSFAGGWAEALDILATTRRQPDDIRDSVRDYAISQHIHQWEQAWTP
mgnify:CR=1 FL=1